MDMNYNRFQMNFLHRLLRMMEKAVDEFNVNQLEVEAGDSLEELSNGPYVILDSKEVTTLIDLKEFFQTTMRWR